jgi:serine/threonine protein phosphatase PrpC
MTAPRALLLGREHVDLAKIATEAVGANAAVALSKGRFEKVYYHVDPNEDCAGAVAGPRATLLTVADGHNGDMASEVAVSTVLEFWGYDPPAADLADELVVTTLTAINDAILQRTQDDGSPAPDSRTTLLVAFVTPTRVQWASFGDSALYLAERRGVRRLDTSSNFYAGYLMSAEDVDQRTSRGTIDLDGTSTLVAVTDGLMEFSRDPEVAIATALEESDGGTPVDAARAVALEAFKAGAGDNIAVALTRV